MNTFKNTIAESELKTPEIQNLSNHNWPPSPQRIQWTSESWKEVRRFAWRSVRTVAIGVTAYRLGPYGTSLFLLAALTAYLAVECFVQACPRSASNLAT